MRRMQKAAAGHNPANCMMDEENNTNTQIILFCEPPTSEMQGRNPKHSTPSFAETLQQRCTNQDQSAAVSNCALYGASQHSWGLRS